MFLCYNYNMREHLERIKNVLKLGDRVWHFDINPDRVRAFFMRHERAFGWGIFGLVVILIFTSTLFTRASVARFYPERCLGEWENPQGAQGIPNVVSTFSSEEAVSAALGVLTYDREEYERGLAEEELTRRKQMEFNRQNSAVLENRAADLFCGDFRGEVPADALPQKFVLKFSWEMKETVLEEGLNPPNGGLAEPTIDTILEEGLNPEVVEPTIDTLPDNPLVPPYQGDLIPPPLIRGGQEGLELEKEPSAFFEIFHQAFAQEPEPSPELPTGEAVGTPTSENVGVEPVSEPNLPEELPVQEIPPEVEVITEEVPVSVPEVIEQVIENITEQVEEVLPSPTLDVGEAQSVASGEFLEVLMSLDGANWETIGSVGRSNWKNMEIEIAPEKIGSWDQISRLQISLRSVLSIDVVPAVYLDAMWLEVSYEKGDEPEIELTPEEIEKAERIELDSDKIFLTPPKSFRAGESWEFEINTEVDSEELHESIPESKPEVVPEPESIVEPIPESEPNPIINFLFKKALAKSPKVKVLKAEIFNNNGERMASDISVQEIDGKIRLVAPAPPVMFRPGRYEIKVDLLIDGKLYSSTQSFLWGVLAINTNKSIFLPAQTRLPNESAYLQMAVLDDSGHTVCDADLELEIKEPSGIVMELSGALGTIIKSPTCGPDNVTDDPDYFSHYTLDGTGTYALKLTNLKNNYEIADSFEVRDSVPFEIERIGATRINPFKAKYVMTFKIKANQDFDGEIIETVPESFEITPAPVTEGSPPWPEGYPPYATETAG